MAQLSVHVAVMVREAMSPGPAAEVVCSCVRRQLAYIVPPAVVDDVPAPKGEELVLKLALMPLVLMALSPVAVVAGWV